jgi:small subunit ribosomal protein S16
MLKIKLARFGKRNQPHYRFVVIEGKTKRDAEYTASLGHYAPTATPKILSIEVEEYKKWIKNGAQPTETVAGLFARYESGNPFPEKPKKLSKKAKAKVEAEKIAAAEAKAAPAEEVAPAPQEEVAAEAKTAEVAEESSTSSKE